MINDPKKIMEDFIGKLNTFMSNTNEMLAQLTLDINNIKVDIDKLKKKRKEIIITGR